jgi:hypothetical protein
MPMDERSAIKALLLPAVTQFGARAASPNRVGPITAAHTVTAIATSKGGTSQASNQPS